jgi:D-alanyl-D-alanine carboxypeptidase
MDYVDSWLRHRCDTGDVPGFVVGVAHKGRMVLNRAYGYADLEHETRLTPRHIFRIASHSKTFTATAVMQLVERGALRLDDPVVDHLPWLAAHDDRRFREVTVRQLLSHGAGVIRDGLDSEYWQLARPFPDETQFRAEILAARLVLDANVKLKYSNFGYTLLGLLIEAASGQPYNRYVTEHIIRPLGLRRTGPEYGQAMAPKLVTGYGRADVARTRMPIPPVDTRAMSAATGFYGTAEELCTYFTAQMTGSRQLLRDESKREMQRVQWHSHRPGPGPYEDYGLGLILESVGRRRTIGHSGGFPGHITRSMLDPDDGLVVVALTNCIDGPATPIVRGIFGVIDYFQQHDRGVAPDELRRLEGRFYNLWSVADVVVTGRRVVATSPATWEPLAAPDQLDVVDPTTLRVGEASSFGSEGELVRFTVKADRVATVSYTGATMWPEAVWLRRQRRGLARLGLGGTGRLSTLAPFRPDPGGRRGRRRDDGTDRSRCHRRTRPRDGDVCGQALTMSTVTWNCTSACSLTGISWVPRALMGSSRWSRRRSRTTLAWASTASTMSEAVTEPKSLPSEPALAGMRITMGTRVRATVSAASRSRASRRSRDRRMALAWDSTPRVAGMARPLGSR